MKIFKTHMFKWWEIGMLKICLFSLGIILALYFRDVFINLMWLWWTLLIITIIYWIIWTIKKAGEDKKK